MQRPYRRRQKSARHVAAANEKWRRDALRREAEAEANPQPPEPADARQPFALQLRSAGGLDLHIEPCPGLIAWCAVDASTGKTVARAALKTLLHWVADELPKTTAFRNL